MDPIGQLIEEASILVLATFAGVCVALAIVIGGSALTKKLGKRGDKEEDGQE